MRVPYRCRLLAVVVALLGVGCGEVTGEWSEYAKYSPKGPPEAHSEAWRKIRAATYIEYPIGTSKADAEQMYTGVLAGYLLSALPLLSPGIKASDADIWAAVEAQGGSAESAASFKQLPEAVRVRLRQDLARHHGHVAEIHDADMAEDVEPDTKADQALSLMEVAAPAAQIWLHPKPIAGESVGR